MVLAKGILQIGTGGEGLVEEVAHGAVLAVDLLGGGVGPSPQSADEAFPAPPPA